MKLHKFIIIVCILSHCRLSGRSRLETRGGGDKGGGEGMSGVKKVQNLHFPRDPPFVITFDKTVQFVTQVSTSITDPENPLGIN